MKIIGQTLENALKTKKNTKKSAGFPGLTKKQRKPLQKTSEAENYRKELLAHFEHFSRRGQGI